MSTVRQDVSVPLSTAAPAVAARPAGRKLNRPLLLVALIVAAFALTYAYAWSRAQALGATYLKDVDASYNAGKYIEALVGYDQFDPKTNKYITHGGYMQVEKIWGDPYAQPKPAGVERASQRINDIIYHKMTLDEAQQFVQANTGKNNPYFGIIYLRLGELYQQKGDVKDAKDVYSTIPDSFPNDPQLVAQAKQHLQALNQQQPGSGG